MKIDLQLKYTNSRLYSIGILGQVIGDFGGYFSVLTIPVCPHNCVMEMKVKYFSAITFPLLALSFLL